MSSAASLNRGTKTINAEELFYNLQSHGSSSDIAQDFETHWKWPDEIGDGLVTIINIRPGIELVMGRYRLLEDTAICRVKSPRLVILGYSVSGGLRSVFHSQAETDFCWNLEQGRSTVSYRPECNLDYIKLSTVSRAFYIYISIHPRILKDLLNAQYGQLPAALCRIADGSQEDRFHQVSVISPMARIALQQIINCPYRASLKKLFLESKVLELISGSLAQLEQTLAPVCNAQSGPEAMARVLEARNILLSNLETPPSLLELARLAGTNRTTLNKGFHHFLGASVFDYLRTQRLEKARALLHTENISIIQAANQVGYAHQSSFTRAYKKHFGTYPTAHLRQPVQNNADFPDQGHGNIKI